MLPVLETERLVLRSMMASDAANIQKLASAYEIASNTLTMPHPYPDGAAEVFISAVRDEMEGGESFVFGITLKGEVIGCIGLHPTTQFNRAEMGYWIGLPYWGQGYTTEAAAKILEFGFETLELNRIYAAHFTHNPASGRVMQKIGLRYEGTMRQHYRRFDVYQDTAFYGLLREDYVAIKKGDAAKNGAGG
ncbi:MAG: GNAT family N-acetyltransferase [Anaerolineae bacterium]|nr:GNAT family N-acetyltransferase [Anaerolineae bacterium]